jgi:hypothetical protein
MDHCYETGRGWIVVTDSREGRFLVNARGAVATVFQSRAAALDFRDRTVGTEGRVIKVSWTVETSTRTE